MSFSVVTNVSSLVAQENLRVNNEFQNRTIQRLTSGYRINASGDDAAGLAVANKYRSDIVELVQGVRNANDGLSTLQIVDGGLSNISKILDRLKTLATQSASTTFTGNRTTLNNEYQTMLTEINRQANNIGLVAGGSNNTLVEVYIGGGSTASNAKVSIDLGGSSNRVDTTSLGINSTAVSAGGTVVGTLDMNNTSTSFLASGATQVFTFNIYDTTLSTTGQITVTLQGGSTAAGSTGATLISSLNTSLNSYGISAATNASGYLAFSSTRAFSVSVAAPSAGTGVLNSSATYVDNAGVYRVASQAFTAVTAASGAETLTFQTASGSASVTLDATTGAASTTAISAINAQTASLGIYAIYGTASGRVTIESNSSFSLSVYDGQIATGLFGTSTGLQTVSISSPDSTATTTGNALAALSSLSTAITNLGVVQGKVGTGQNKLQYAIQLAQSQISSYSAAESRIRDADIAAEAANLTKAQVMQQASLAAMAQANAAPQAVLALLRG